MPAFIHGFWAQFYVVNPHEQLMLTGLVGVVLVCVLFRLILAIGYYGQNALVSMAAKTVTSKDDIGKLKKGAFARAAKEYVTLGERGITRIDTRAIVERNLLKVNFAFWNFQSMHGFVVAMENAVLPLGILFAFFAAEEGRAAFVVCVVLAFLMSRLAAAVLDCRVAKETFVTNAVYLLDREIGRFFANDAAAALFALREELTAGLTSQGQVLSASIEKLGADFADAVATSMDKMAAGMEHAAHTIVENTSTLLTDVSAQAQALAKPLEDWQNAIQSAEKMQTALNAALLSMNAAVGNFAGVADNIGPMIAEDRAALHEHSRVATVQIEKLAALLLDARENNHASALRNDAVEAQLEMVRAHQGTLEKSVQQYEVSLREITTQLGASMGKMVDFHLQQSYGTLTDGVKESLDQIMTGNNDLLKRLQDLFEQMQAQSRSESAAIMRIKEQMDIHFAELKAKV